LILILLINLTTNICLKKISDKESENPLTKEEQEEELEKIFGVRTTAEFRIAT